MQVWTEVMGGAKYWRSVAMAANGVTQTAVASNGNIWRSTNSGETWTEVIVAGGAKTWYSAAMSADGVTQTAVVQNGGIWTSGQCADEKSSS